MRHLHKFALSDEDYYDAYSGRSMEKIKDEARDMKEWTRSLGWTGRIYKQENML